MYASHKKDINRHKSFHPLTYRNLSKVEQRQEREESRKKANEERNLQLRRDQEQRRYDDLVLAASAGSVSGQLAKFRQVENIFAAESQVVSKGSSETVDNGISEMVPTVLKTSSALTFKKEEVQNNVEVKREERKRGREEDESSSSSDNKGVVTGFLSSSDSAQLRKELDRLQKERHDPLRRIERFQNRTVAAEAKRRALETKMTTLHNNNGNSNSDSNSAHTEKDVIRGRIQELLELKRQK
ncbi:hypothetical protein LSM04_001872 [Trypanosoma melophagium]|uniref:uncharacterized protein n=1 Tax=Trypanosoma melophagium TaxID=715481 RepID=UPI00351AA38D|nr:hypothetical protein LSM04_001872 [Trypanosoma melophagium]